MARRRFLANIFEKGIKIIHPLGVNSNPSPSIPFKVIAGIIRATIFHIAPRFIFRSLSFSVSALGDTRSFLAKATATICISATQIRSGGYGNAATGAHTLPKQTQVFCAPGEFNNGEPSKGFSCEINKPPIAFCSAATANFSRAQVSGCANPSTPTGTLAFPSCTTACVICYLFNYGKISEYLSCKIHKCRHALTSWLKVLVDGLCWKADNQIPPFGCTSLSSKGIVAF
jgi:hypothetical protein